MQLIQFLLHNWFIVVLVLVVYQQLVAWRKRAVRAREADRRSGASLAPRRPAAAPGRGPRPAGATRAERPAPGQPPARGGFAASQRRPAAAAPAAGPGPLPGAAAAPERAPAAAAGASAPRRERPAATAAALDAPPAAVAAPALAAPSAEQLRQGVLWAEILGPPRAKKPFQRR